MNSKRLYQVALCIVLMLCLCLGTVNAMAFSQKRLDDNGWINGKHTQVYDVKRTTPNGTLDGKFYLQSSKKNYTTYMYFDFVEDSLFIEDSEAQVELEIADGKQVYSLAVDSQGVTDEKSPALEVFDVGSSLAVDSKQRRVFGTVAIDFKGEADVHLLNIHLYLNSNRYSVYRELQVDRPTTTKPATTKKKKDTTQKATTVHNTDATTSAQATTDTTATEVTTTVTTTSVDKAEPSTKPAPQMTPTEKGNKIMMTVCTGVIALAILMLFAGVVKRKNNSGDK